MGQLKRWEQWLVSANQALIGLMMLLMFVMVFTNVVTRYGFGFSIAWAEEVSSFLMIWVTYLGAGLALRQGRLVAIDLLQDRLPERLRWRLRVGLGLLILVFLGLLTYYGMQFVVFGWNKQTLVTLIPRGIPYLVIPIGALVLALHLVLFFRDFVDRRWDALEEPDEHEMRV